jgi:hypothetical protein
LFNQEQEKEMPRNTRTKEPEETGRDYTKYAEKEITPTMEAFGDWLIDVVGLDFPNAKAETQFRQGVALGGTLRMEFQRSPEWAEDERNSRANGKPKSTAKAAKEKAPARRGRAKSAADEDEDTEDEAPAKPAARTGRGRGRPAASGAPKSGRGRGRAAKPAPADEDESGADEEAPY